MEDVEVAVTKPAEMSYSERMLQMGVSDIDLADTSDPQAVTEYVVEIIQYMRDIERSFLPTSDYIMRHPDLTWHSRSLLNNWLVEVHWRFKFHPETLYLAINVLDRYMTLTPTPVTRSRLQAVGTGALIIASKYEETMVPSMSEFSSITQSKYVIT